MTHLPEILDDVMKRTAFIFGMVLSKFAGNFKRALWIPSLPYSRT
jgi:hypothetical protein